jgi:putative phosphonate transport system ATP-binding protein
MLYQDRKPTEGTAILDGFKNVSGMKGNIFDAGLLERNRLRSTDMSMIYQNPRIGLNFSFSAGGNIAERIITAGERAYANIKERVEKRLVQTEMPVERAHARPEEFSGGQQLRIQISKALANSPRLLLLDEPTTGLDLSVQARIIDLIKALQKEIGFAMIVVSHDLGVIRHLTDITMVMKNGCMVEYGLTDQILEDPQHRYTQSLVSSVL